MGHVEHLQGWRAPWNETEFISALTGGGDSRLRVDPAGGTNKYFVPPTPRVEGVCFSSCIASPISQAGYRQAMRCYFDLATARTPDDTAARRASWQANVTGGRRTGGGALTAPLGLLRYCQQGLNGISSSRSLPPKPAPVLPPAPAISGSRREVVRSPPDARVSGFLESRKVSVPL